MTFQNQSKNRQSSVTYFRKCALSMASTAVEKSPLLPQVKINGSSREMLESAAEQFGGKEEQEIKNICLVSSAINF
jgi:hypothetical protein